jgi:hypothetical protein
MARLTANKKPARRPAARGGFWTRPKRWLAGLAALVVSALVAFIVPKVVPGLVDRAKNAAGAAVLSVSVADDRSGIAGDSWSARTDLGHPPLSADGTWPVYPPDWFREHGALPLPQSGYRIVLENQRSTSLELLDVRPVVQQRRAPYAGALYWDPPQGEVPDVALRVDLDSSVPVVQDPKNGTPYFASRHQQLAQGERVVLRVQAVSARCDCLWRIVAEYQDGKGTHDLTIPPADQPPLETTAPARAYRVVYNGLEAGYPRVDPVKFCRGPESPCTR